MTITEMTEVVKNALDEYRKAKATNDKTAIERAINEMENVYIMVCCYPVPGSDMLRKTILEARTI
jgi:hypothetical protein